MEILIATKNEYKVGELLHYLEGLDNLKIHLLKDQDIQVNVVESGSSLEENAQKKAIEISKKTKFLTLASDGGVDIPVLGEKWDVLRNQRIVGENSSDVEKAKTVLKMLEGLNGEDRKVVFYHALALAKNGKLVWSSVDITEQGYVAQNLPDENIPKSKWFSHIWYYPEFEKVFNKLNEEELKKVREQSTNLKKKLHEVLTTIEKKNHF